MSDEPNFRNWRRSDSIKINTAIAAALVTLLGGSGFTLYVKDAPGKLNEMERRLTAAEAKVESHQVQNSDIRESLAEIKTEIRYLRQDVNKKL